MAMMPEQELAVYKMVFGSLADVEWSATVRGPGSGPMFSGDDGSRNPACPVCRGLKNPSNEFIDSAVGHQPGCKLAAALGRKTRPLKSGEQNELPV